MVHGEAEELLSRTREQQILTRFADEDDSPLMSETTTLRLPQDNVGRGENMGYFRFRKTFSILPGVRINLSKTGVSGSLGG